MPLTAEQIEQQKKQAEELLFSGPQPLGFAKSLFFGHFNAPLLFPYPQLPAAEQAVVDAAVAEVRKFADEHIDAAAIDRNADIPPEVVRGLADLGVLGMTAPRAFGGRGFSQMGYCRVMEIIGGHCSSTAVFVNAHHSIGIRGTATGRLAFHDMPVPAENILGQLGKGLRVALTVLDFGRTTFGASCTGAAKTCLRAAVKHANRRVQFKQALGEFELVKKKIAFMAANAFAMEATVSQCAHFIDSGAEDYMLETAMLKVWSTEALWQIVNDTVQIFGGKAYFSDQPYE